MSNSRRRLIRVKAPPTEQQALPPAKPYLEERGLHGWRFEEDIPDQFVGWRLIVRNATAMSSEDPADVPNLVIEEV